MKKRRFDKERFFRQGFNSLGQVVVEYVLLLMIAVSLAALVVNQLGSRNPDEPGVITAKWLQILNLIAEDIPDP